MHSWAKEVARTSHSICCWPHHAGRQNVLCLVAPSMKHRYPQRVHTTRIASPGCHPVLGFPKSPWFRLVRDAGDFSHVNPDYLKKDHEASLFQVLQWCWIMKTSQKETAQSNLPERDSLGKGPESRSAWPDTSWSMAGRWGAIMEKVWLFSSCPRVTDRCSVQAKPLGQECDVREVPAQ